MIKDVVKLLSFNKLAILIGIAMPGVSKFVFAFILNSTIGLENLGIYASDLNIALIVSALTGVGFSVILSNRVPRIDNIVEQRYLFGRVFLYANILAVLFSICIYIMHVLDVVDSFWGVLFMVVGYTNYFVLRQYFIARRIYKFVLFIELGVFLFVSLGFLFLSNVFNPIAIHALLLMVFFLVSNYFISKFDFGRIYIRAEVKTGFGFGFSNLSSTFLGLISVPLAKQLLGPLYAGFLGLINPVIQICVLFPRSLSRYFLPLLARQDFCSSAQRKIYLRFNNYNTSFLFAVIAILTFSWFLFLYLFPNSDLILENSSLVLFLLFANLFVTQISLPDFNLLAAWDKFLLSFYINFLNLLSFVFIFIILSLFFPNSKSFFSIYIALIVINFLRWSYLRYRVKAFFAQSKKKINH